MGYVRLIMSYARLKSNMNHIHIDTTFTQKLLKIIRTKFNLNTSYIHIYHPKHLNIGHRPIKYDLAMSAICCIHDRVQTGRCRELKLFVDAVCLILKMGNIGTLFFAKSFHITLIGYIHDAARMSYIWFINKIVIRHLTITTIYIFIRRRENIISKKFVTLEEVLSSGICFATKVEGENSAWFVGFIHTRTTSVQMRLPQMGLLNPIWGSTIARVQG
ncbi:hypothetical protein FF38_05339 [Lucilia cuprina]|uniref:Uncharacterized protein n=1 Tax=Lucilia cuprina TaxID=7375 RepID=A0A0L0BTX2_LUCCU|nr:hypothetical protein FF38_05339 [Lucilia cuprina]